MKWISTDVGPFRYAILETLERGFDLVVLLLLIATGVASIVDVSPELVRRATSFL